MDHRLSKFEALQQVWITLDNAMNAADLTKDDIVDLADIQRKLLIVLHRNCFIWVRDGGEEDLGVASDKAREESREESSRVQVKATHRIGRWRNLK